jgi:hypothetical protein
MRWTCAALSPWQPSVAPSLAPYALGRQVTRGGSVASAAVAVACLLLPAAQRLVQAADAPTGLDAPVRASWSGTPLRVWADRAGALAGKPVIVDRRLDPDAPITLDCRGEPLREVLDRVAASLQAEVAELRSSVRIVPGGQGSVCERAEAARDQALARLPAGGRTVVLAKRAWTWHDAAQPRDLVAAAAAEAGVAVAGIDALPHDHFPAAALAPLSLAERLDLVLAHFDRRIDWRPADGRPTGTIIAIDADLPPPGTPRADRDARPRPATGGRQPKPAIKDSFTLRLEAPLEQALAALAAQFALELDLDRKSLAARGIASGEIVRADVANASRDELLDAVLRPLALEWKITDGRLQVFAPAP